MFGFTIISVEELERLRESDRILSAILKQHRPLQDWCTVDGCDEDSYPDSLPDEKPCPCPKHGGPYPDWAKK